MLLPGLAFAAFDDVSLTTDTVLSVNGITLNVSGSTASIESIVVNSTDFVVTLQTGSSFQVTAPSRNVLATDQASSGVSVHTCNDTESILGYTANSGQIIVTVTPSATLCTSPAVAASTSSGGGFVVPTTPLVTPVVSTVQPSTPEAIAAIKTQLIALIQELITLLSQELVVLLNQEIQTMQSSGSY
ncbi:MAG: hypothetical protein Q8P83_01745 [bacterium]|nr:hypothetical protein [bacterium]